MKFQCQQSGKCCKSHGEPGYVSLNSEDVARLQKHLGKHWTEFAEVKTFDSFRYQTNRHQRMILKGTEKQCPFLVKNQCSIHEVKPLQCRTYPYWPELIENGNFVGMEMCPGVGKGDELPQEKIVEALKEDEEGFWK